MTLSPSNSRKATGPDVQQVAEETGHKVPKTKAKEAVKPKSNEMADEQRTILRALDALGGKDIGSMAIAKEAGTVKTHPDALRAPIRAAMEAFLKHGWVTRHKKGAGYLFSLMDKGKQALSVHPRQGKDREAGSTPASNPSVPPNGLLTLTFNVRSAGLSTRSMLNTARTVEHSFEPFR